MRMKTCFKTSLNVFFLKLYHSCVEASSIYSSPLSIISAIRSARSFANSCEKHLLCPRMNTVRMNTVRMNNTRMNSIDRRELNSADRRRVNSVDRRGVNSIDRCLDFYAANRCLEGVDCPLRLMDHAFQI